MTEKLAYGQCQRCGTYADSPAYKCENCGTNYVELFPSPVALDSAGAPATTQPSEGSNLRSQKVESIGERMVSFTVCLAVAGIAAVPAGLFLGAAIFAWFFVCGENPPPSCGTHLSQVWIPFFIFATLGVIASLVVVVSLIVALVQVALGIKQHWPGRTG